MSGSSALRLRRLLTLIAAIAPAACDDPLRMRPAAITGELALFAILEPERGVQMIQAQESPSVMPSVLRVTIDSGGVALASDSTSIERFQSQCFQRYGAMRDPLEEHAWVTQCVTVPFRPRHGATYRVRLEAPGRPVASGTTTVPGDFRIVSHEFTGNPPETTQLRATWTRSGGAHRYVVMLEATPGFSCADPTGCKRWIAVVEDTTISATIDASLLAESHPPYTVAVFAMSRELLAYMTTGSTSGYFPVPPAQNVTGGQGAVGAWVRRGIARVMDVDMQRVADGVFFQHWGTEAVTMTVYAPEGPTYHCNRSPEYCIALAPGDTLTVPWARVQSAGEQTEEVHVELCRVSNRNDCSWHPMRY